MSVSGHFRTIWRYRWFVAAVAVGAAVLVYLAGSVQAPTYTAAAEVNVIVPASPVTGQASQSDVLFAASTYAELAMTAPVVEAAARGAGLHLSETQAAARLSVKPSSTVGTINIAAKGPSRRGALRFAESESKQLLQAAQSDQAAAARGAEAPIRQQIASIETQLRQLPANSPAVPGLQSQLNSLGQALAQLQLQPAAQLVLVAPARAPAAPSSPRPKTWALLAFLTGLVLAAEGAAGYQSLSGRFSPDDVEDQLRRLTALPVLARIPPRRRRGKWQIRTGRPWLRRTDDQPTGPETWDVDVREAFRTMRARVRHLAETFEGRTWAILGAEPGEGATRVATGLAMASAELSVPVSLIEADVRKPGLARRLGVQAHPGLSDVLFGIPLEQAMRPVPGYPTLSALPGGTPIEDGAGMLSERLDKAVLSALVDREYVIVDTPPWTSYPDALATALECEAAVLVVNGSRSRRKVIEGVLEQIQQVDVHLVGLVITDGAPRRSRQLGARTRQFADRWLVRAFRSA
jgi:Mrp family chromosome partitioning ATPase/capsular polysaccharide biosynthesis protein